MKYLKTVVKILVSALALFFVFSKIDLETVKALIIKAKFVFILLGLLSFLMSQVVSAFRLNAYFRTIKIYLSDATNIRLYALGMFYNLLLPGGIGGDAYKGIYLRKKFNVKVKLLFQALLLDRLIGLLAITLLIVILPSFLQNVFPLQEYYWFLTAPLIAFGYLGYRYLFIPFVPVFGTSLLQSILVQLLQLLAVWFLLKALGLGRVPYAYYLLFLLSSIAAAIPFTVGGAGARELVFLFGAEWFGIDMNMAVTLSLLFYLCTVTVSLSGLYFSFKKDLDVW